MHNFEHISHPRVSIVGVEHVFTGLFDGFVMTLCYEPLFILVNLFAVSKLDVKLEFGNCC